MNFNYNYYKLWENVSSLNGVGEKLTTTLKKLNIINKIDLLLHLPTNINIISHKELASEIIFNQNTSIPVTIKSYVYNIKKKFKKTPFQIIAEDKEKNIIYINFFNYYSTSYLKKLFPLDSIKTICGKFEKFGTKITINHPQINNNLNTKQPLSQERNYKITPGITNKKIRELILKILKEPYTFPEWFPDEFINSLNLPTFTDALHNIHLGDNFQTNYCDKNLLRLSLDEMLAFQLKLIKALEYKPNSYGYQFSDNSNLVKILYKNLPFTLTTSQTNAIKEIFIDLKSNKQMVRLLEGDVGSGKTIVAIFSAILAISSNHMVVFMAPTESLATQHFNTFNKYAPILNIKVALLKGNTLSKDRKTILNKLEKNQINILIGTHAIFQPDIVLNNLGLIIIDEQHKFGVAQRLKLIKKELYPNILMLSATPIPRTLALTHYGHIPISRLDQKPSTRKQIITKAIPNNKLNKVLLRIKEKILLEKQKAFWICPLVEQSEHFNFTPATERYNSLLQLLPSEYVWLLHGKMTPQEKDEVLINFRKAKKGILVSTTVIEVGIDIPDTNIIIIEHAERYGLAQLHQLRGRVGRGNSNAYCVLLYSPENSSLSTKRMEIMEKSNDGFYIAEKDFELRGAGNILGTKQSGETPFKIATIELQTQYMKKISSYAKYIYINQPEKYLEYYKILEKIFHFNLNEFNFIEAFKNG